jgi:hypothetical protein
MPASRESSLGDANGERSGRTMRWGDPLFGRVELYILVGVAALLAVAYVVQFARG